MTRQEINYLIEQKEHSILQLQEEIKQLMIQFFTLNDEFATYEETTKPILPLKEPYLCGKMNIPVLHTDQGTGRQFTINRRFTVRVNDEWLFNQYPGMKFLTMPKAPTK